jgi:hypothetical protein
MKSSMQKVQLLDPAGSVSEAELSFSVQKPWRMELRTQSGMEFISTARDLFASMQEIRTGLEVPGYKLLCNGARLDVFPSGMSRDMSGGMVAYVLTMGKYTTPEDIVRIIDPAAPEQIASVMQQEEFHKRWLDSFA